LFATVVGDSLAVGTEPYFRAPTHAQVGRTLQEGVSIIRNLDTHILVVSLGTNNDPSTPFKHAIRVAKRHADCVVWITIYRRGYNYSKINKLIRQKTVAVRWGRAVHRHPGWIGPDGVHATPHGYRMRAKLMRRAVEHC
jgi:hypothetical protein